MLSVLCYYFIKLQSIFFLSRDKVSFDRAQLIQDYSKTYNGFCEPVKKKRQNILLFHLHALSSATSPQISSLICDCLLISPLQFCNYVQSATQKMEPLCPNLNSLMNNEFVSASLVHVAHLLRPTSLQNRCASRRKLFLPIGEQSSIRVESHSLCN